MAQLSFFQTCLELLLISSCRMLNISNDYEPQLFITQITFQVISYNQSSSNKLIQMSILQNSNVQYLEIIRKGQMRTKTEQYHELIRNRFIQQKFQQARQQFNPIISSDISVQFTDRSEDVHYFMSGQTEKSWGYLFDQFKNFNNLNTLATLYNHLHYDRFHINNSSIIETLIRKILDQLEYQTLLHGSSPYQQIDEADQAIIIMLILIYRELDRFLSSQESIDQQTRQIFSMKINQLIKMMNIKENVKISLGIFSLKELTN